MRPLLSILIFYLPVLSIAFADTDNELNNIIVTPLRSHSIIDLSSPNRPTVSALIYFLSRSGFYGKWYNEDNSKEHFFQTPAGLSHAAYHRRGSAFEIYLYSGTEDHLRFKLPRFNPYLRDPHFEEESMKLHFENVLVSVEEVRGQGVSTKRDCLASYKFNFISKVDESPFRTSSDIEADQENLAIDFQIHSSNCSINIRSRLLVPRYSEFSSVNILDYLIYIKLIGFIVRLLTSRWVSNNLLTAYNRVSLGKLLILQAFDFYVVFQYWLAETSKLKPAKSITVPSIIMILAFMASMIHAVPRGQRKLNQLGYFLVRCLNYSLWTVVPGAALAISLVLKEHRAILLVACLYEVPQIIQNFLTNTKYTWDLSSFVFLGLPKVFYISWTLAFSDILLDSKCDREINIFCVLIFIQFFIVILQTRRPKLWTNAESPYKIKL